MSRPLYACNVYFVLIIKTFIFFLSKLQQRIGIPSDKQTVSFAGKPLIDDDEKVENLITTSNWYTIDVNHMLKGGGKCRFCLDDTTTFSAPCKCQFCSNCFFYYCDHIASKGNTTITCPRCAEEWDLNAIQNTSIISDTQFRQLSEKLSQNHIKSHVADQECDYTQLLDLLSKAKKTTIDGIPNCPSIRLCPSCGTGIQHHEGSCKRMMCQTCHKQSCFVCLTDWRYHTNCTCTPAPIQTSVPRRK